MIKDRIALVSGGNRGIGLEVCRQLAEKGLIVFQGTRKLSTLNRKTDPKISPIELDVTSSRSIKNVFDTIKQKHGRLDVLINNAAISKGSKGIVNVPEDDYRKVFDTNYFGAFAMIQAFYPLLSKGDSSCIINVSSRMGTWDSLRFGYAAYRQSKIALNALTFQLSNELAGDNINVYAACPGWVRTDMGGAGADKDASEGADTIVWLATAKNIRSGKFYAERKVVKW